MGPLDTFTSRRGSRSGTKVNMSAARLAAHKLIALDDERAAHWLRSALGRTNCPPGTPRQAASRLLTACGGDFHRATEALKAARAELEATG